MVEDEVPEIVVSGLCLGNFIVGLRLASMNDVYSFVNFTVFLISYCRPLTWKFYRVLNEKNRDVVANNIPVALLSVKLDGESTDISHGISAASAS